MANYISKIFGKSPVGPIQAHMETCFNCAKELVPFFECVVKEDWKGAEASCKKIIELENEADEQKKQLRSELPRSLLMPVPRQDLLNLVIVQDRIANRANDIADLVTGRKMQIPDDIQERFLAFVQRNVDAAKKARKSIRELDELYETGFRGAEAAFVESLVVTLDQIENDTHEMHSGIRSALFGIENELAPIDVMFLYRVLELIGDIGDFSERVGRSLETLLYR